MHEFLIDAKRDELVRRGKPDPTDPRTCEVCRYTEGQVDLNIYDRVTKDIEELDQLLNGKPLSSNRDEWLRRNLKREHRWEQRWSRWAGYLICPRCRQRGDSEKMVILLRAGTELFRL